MIADPREIQRLRFQPGQDLLSRDFRDGAAFDLSLREWHNRALHQAFGVVSGLVAVPIPDKGSPMAVEVSAGLAYECTGRALFLPAAARVPVPSPWPGIPQRLVLRSGPAMNGAGNRAGVFCLGSAGLGGDELAWVPETQWRPGVGVPLARLDNAPASSGEEDPRPVWDPAFHPSRARALARQRIGSGITIAGGTPWDSWFYTGVQQGLPFHGIRVWVDTRASGFRRPPCYFAYLQGALPTEPPSLWHLPLFGHIGEARQDGFWFQVVSPANVTLSNEPSNPPISSFYGILAAARQSLSVGWLGIEKPEEPEPEPEVSDGKP